LILLQQVIREDTGVTQVHMSKPTIITPLTTYQHTVLIGQMSCWSSKQQCQSTEGLRAGL